EMVTFRIAPRTATVRITRLLSRERSHILGRRHSIMHPQIDPSAIKVIPKSRRTTPETFQPIAMSRGTIITPPAHSSLAVICSGFLFFLGIFPVAGVMPNFASNLLARRLFLVLPGIWNDSGSLVLGVGIMAGHFHYPPC